MKKVILIAVATFLFSSPSFSQEYYLSGTIINITSYTGGLLIQLDKGVPDNCAGSSSYGWMRIPEESKAMISVALMLWATGNRDVTVYTNGHVSGSYCTINQLDPV